MTEVSSSILASSKNYNRFAVSTRSLTIRMHSAQSSVVVSVFILFIVRSVTLGRVTTCNSPPNVDSQNLPFDIGQSKLNNLYCLQARQSGKTDTYRIFVNDRHWPTLTDTFFWGSWIDSLWLTFLWNVSDLYGNYLSEMSVNVHNYQAFFRSTIQNSSSIFLPVRTPFVQPDRVRHHPTFVRLKSNPTFGLVTVQSGSSFWS